MTSDNSGVERGIVGTKLVGRCHKVMLPCPRKIALLVGGDIETF